MKKIIIALALGVLSSSAFAAGAPSKKSVTSTPIPTNTTFDWSGFYVGLNGGYLSSTPKLTTVASNTASYPDFGVGQYNKPHLTGYAIGGELGYNQQINNLVYGAFANIAYSNASATTWSVNACCGQGDDRFKSKLSGLGIIGGRLGYAFDNILASVNGGVALGKYDLNINDHNLNYLGIIQHNSYGGGSDSKWLVGLALGAELDYALNSNWSLGIDYKYVLFSPKNLSAGGVGYHNDGTLYGPVTYIMDPKNMRTQISGINLKYKL